MDWVGVPDDISQYVGFVYIITDRKTNRYYIGQKKFWMKKKLKPLKGRKNFRHKLVESDWKTYLGSNKEFSELIEKTKDKTRFSRVILHLCKTKGMMNYLETLEQFDNNVLFDEKSYNSIINCRISRNQLQSSKNKDDEKN